MGTVWAVLFGIVLAGLWYGGHAMRKSLDSYDSIRVGMPSYDTDAIEGQDCYGRIRVGMFSDDTHAIMK